VTEYLSAKELGIRPEERKWLRKAAAFLANMKPGEEKKILGDDKFVFDMGEVVCRYECGTAGQFHSTFANFEWGLDHCPARVQHLAGPERTGNVGENLGLDLLASEPRPLIPRQHVIEPARIQAARILIARPGDNDGRGQPLNRQQNRDRPRCSGDQNARAIARPLAHAELQAMPRVGRMGKFGHFVEPCRVTRESAQLIWLLVGVDRRP
jgi:hypothetical protein